MESLSDVVQYATALVHNESARVNMPCASPKNLSGPNSLSPVKSLSAPTPIDRFHGSRKKADRAFLDDSCLQTIEMRSEERRVGKEWRKQEETEQSCRKTEK